jgi:hypothetical protein
MTARDHCKGLRASYKSLTTLISANSIVALLFAGIPLYIMIGWATTDLTRLPYIGGFIYLLLVLIALAWIIAGLCMWRTYPNLLSVAVFVYTSLAHWAFVSILMVLFYGWSFLPFQLFGRVMGALLPLIAALYICGDVLVEVRKRLFAAIANAQALAAMGEEATATPTPPV